MDQANIYQRDYFINMLFFLFILTFFCTKKTLCCQSHDFSLTWKTSNICSKISEFIANKRNCFNLSFCFKSSFLPLWQTYIVHFWINNNLISLFNGLCFFIKRLNCQAYVFVCIFLLLENLGNTVSSQDVI